jgi:hypothetical protein
MLLFTISPKYGEKMEDVRDSWIRSVVARHGEEIRSAVPALQPSMKPNIPAWNRWFDDAPWVIDVLSDIGTDISRGTLKNFARDSELSSQEGRRRVFVATLAWGVGSTNRYYGRHKTLLMSPLLDGALESSYKHLLNNRVEDAFVAMNPLPGITYRFHTKWLWIVGSTLGLQPMPLTFDNRVGQSLRQLKWPEMQRRQAQRQRWHRYIQDAESVSRELGVSEEHVELWLFQRE